MVYIPQSGGFPGNPDPTVLLQRLQEKDSLSSSELEACASAAAAWNSQGDAYNLQDDPVRAEALYLQALRLNQRLLDLTGAQIYADAAAENCAGLADVCMQQGNMHGADRYYAQILQFRRK